MKILPKKSLLASALLLSINITNVQAIEMCGEKTLPRQGEVPANEIHCITDYGHYLYVDVPYDNSDVTMTTSGGTFTGSDADITLYLGTWWGDGDVDRNDIRAFSLAIRRNEELHISFDLNDDGVINSHDVKAMRNICSYDRCRATPAQ